MNNHDTRGMDVSEIYHRVSGMLRLWLNPSDDMGIYLLIVMISDHDRWPRNNNFSFCIMWTRFKGAWIDDSDI